MAFFDVPKNTALKIRASRSADWRQRYKLSKNGSLIGIYDEASRFTLPPDQAEARYEIVGEYYHQGRGRHGWIRSDERLIRSDTAIVVQFNDDGGDQDFNDLVVYFQFVNNNCFDRYVECQNREENPV